MADEADWKNEKDKNQNGAGNYNRNGLLFLGV